MSSAARIEIDALDLDEPHVARVRFRQPARPDGQRAELVERDAPRADGPGGADLRRHGVFERREVGGRKRARVELDVAHLGTEVERRRRPAETVLRDGREQMLARVLLHVVEAAVPVEPHTDGPRRHGRGDVVPDLAARLLHVENLDPVQEAVIRGLSPAFGKENRIVENRVRPPRVVAHLEDRGVELRAVRLALVRRKEGCAHFS